MKTSRLTASAVLRWSRVRERGMLWFLMTVGAIFTGLILICLLGMDSLGPMRTIHSAADLQFHVVLLLPYATAAGFLAAIGLWSGDS